MQKMERQVHNYRAEIDNTVYLVKRKNNRVVTLVTNFDSIDESKCTKWSKVKKPK